MDAMRIAMREVVADLPHSDRLVLLLHYADGLTPEEIAVVIDGQRADIAARLGALRRHLAASLNARAAGPSIECKPARQIAAV